jgi:hypothetical protein
LELLEAKGVDDGGLDFVSEVERVGRKGKRQKIGNSQKR